MPKTPTQQDIQSGDSPAIDVVPFPKFSKGVLSTKKGDFRVKEFNPYEFYLLAEALKKIPLSDDVLKRDALSEILGASNALNSLLRGKSIEVDHCRHEAEQLKKHLDQILNDEFRDKDGNLHFKNMDEPIDSHLFWGLPEELTRFEHNLAADLREAATYFVPQTGVYETRSLVERASHHIPSMYRGLLGEMATEDLDNAGRCLAFGLPTASGFHVVRAVEGVLGNYARAFLAEPVDEFQTMRQLLEPLEKLKEDKAAQSSVLPSPKTLRTLDQIRDLDRNPVVHPRESLSPAEARALFDLASSAIIYMLSEMKEIGFESGQGQLGLTPTLVSDETEKAG